MKYKHYVIMISLAVLFGGCRKNPIIHQINVDVLKHHKDTINLSDYTDFDWDRALYFDDFLMGIYVHNDRDSLEKRFNINFRDFPVDKYEGTRPFVFMKGRRIVHSEINVKTFFPDVEKGRGQESIGIFLKIKPGEECPAIIEIKKEDCIFKARSNGYNPVLTHIPNCIKKK